MMINLVGIEVGRINVKESRIPLGLGGTFGLIGTLFPQRIPPLSALTRSTGSTTTPVGSLKERSASGARQGSGAGGVGEQDEVEGWRGVQG